jgi:hypothetical protein
MPSPCTTSTPTSPRGALLRPLPPARPRRGHRQPAAGRHTHVLPLPPDRVRRCAAQPRPPPPPRHPPGTPPAARCPGRRHRATARGHHLFERPSRVSLDVEMRFTRGRGAQPLAGRPLPRTAPAPRIGGHLSQSPELLPDRQRHPGWSGQLLPGGRRARTLCHLAILWYTHVQLSVAALSTEKAIGSRFNTQTIPRSRP